MSPPDEEKKEHQSFQRKDIKNLKKNYNENIFPHEIHNTQGKFLKSIVYGGLDGIITTFAVVSGVMGANLAVGIILVLGLANLVADGLSMAIGDFLSTKSEQEYEKKEVEREEKQLEKFPKEELADLYALYTKRGIGDEDAEKIVNILGDYPKSIVNVMLVEEIGICDEEKSPLKSGLVTFFAFIGFGFVPLAAFVFTLLVPGIEGGVQETFTVAIIITGITLFILGAMKTKLTGRNFMKSGIETLLVGGAAAISAFLIGYLLNFLVANPDLLA